MLDSRMSSLTPRSSFLISSFPFAFMIIIIIIIDQSIIVDLVQVIFFLYIYVFHYYREQINMYVIYLSKSSLQDEKMKCPS